MSSEYSTDLSGLLGATGAANRTPVHNTRDTSVDLDMTDFLTLMVTQLQNQSIDETADTSDMLNQMVQMQMITALTNMTDATIMSYAGSLVGKEVTIGQVNDSGVYEEKLIKVMGTGTYGGEQVIFSEEGDMYYLSDIMAVGRLPEPEEEEGEGGTEAVDKTENGVENGKLPDDRPVEGPEGSEQTGGDAEEDPDQAVDPSAGAEL